MISDKEKQTTVVYEDTFCLYNEVEFDEFISPFYKRFEANGIDTSVFKGKKCLDVGSGSGRGSIFMAECGAKEVVGIDLSEKNIATGRSWAEAKKFDNVSFQQQSSHDLNFDDESFDIVWCNGVLHHSKEPDQGLREISRVLKTGGFMWLYLYGSGGVYWSMVKWVRGFLKELDVRDCINFLRLAEVETRRIAEWMDNWFVPFLRCYTAKDLTPRLQELGFTEAELLKYGTVYDTSERINKKNEAFMMGEGDLRFFCQKTQRASETLEHVLADPDHGWGSNYEDNDSVLAFDSYFKQMKDLLEQIDQSKPQLAPATRLMLSKRVHSLVRTAIEKDEAFDADALKQDFAKVILQLKACS